MDAVFVKKRQDLLGKNSVPEKLKKKAPDTDHQLLYADLENPACKQAADVVIGDGFDGLVDRASDLLKCSATCKDEDEAVKLHEYYGKKRGFNNTAVVEDLQTAKRFRKHLEDDTQTPGRQERIHIVARDGSSIDTW